MKGLKIKKPFLGVGISRVGLFGAGFSVGRSLWGVGLSVVGFSGIGLFGVGLLGRSL